MTNTTPIKERIEKASGPDRELDRDLHLALGLDISDVVHRALWINLYTASLDASLALVERLYPKATIEMSKGLDGVWSASIDSVRRTGSTGPLALLSALTSLPNTGDENV